MSDIQFSPDYILWFSDLKQRISLARQKASLALNAALLELYWEIGRDMVEKEEKAAWGSGLIERLSRDLTHAFPDMKGFSRRNLYAIRQWHLFYSSRSAIVPQPVAQLPWGHNRLIVSKIKDYEEALWYASAANKSGWTRDDLELKIEKQEYKRIGRALTNFPHTLPAVQSGLARETATKLPTVTELEDELAARIKAT
jgi:predicted nuclease of restriction endonuclease-like (RecB) superfamily